MDVFFDPIRYNHYYNCTMYNLTDIPIEERRKPLASAFFFILGTILALIYFPCLYAMSRPKLLAQSCYKLMLFMGIVNVIEMTGLAYQGGIFAFEGAVFCSHPTLSFFTGVLVTTLYYTETNTGCILALNRVLNLLSPSWAERLFAGKRTFIWLIMPIVLPAYFAIFSPPYMYNAVLNSWTLNPHHGYIQNLDPELDAYYFQVAHQFYSCGVIFTLLTTYSTFLITLVIKREKTFSQGTRDRSVFIQVFWISLLCSFAGICYTFDRQLSQIAFMVPLYTYGLIIYQGSPAMIYLLMNKTIRAQIVNWKTPRLTKPSVAVSTGSRVVPLMASGWNASKLFKPSSLIRTLSVRPSPMPITASMYSLSGASIVGRSAARRPRQAWTGHGGGGNY